MNRKDEIASALAQVQSEVLTYSPTLIVVTKTYPLSDVEILHQLGVRDFGENRDDEGVAKSQIQGRWHYQGAIQSQKIRSITTWADVIHSLDDPRHGAKIDRIASELEKKVEVFLQLSLDGDPSRGGVVESELFSLAEEAQEWPAIELAGIMCVPPVEWEAERAFSEIARIHRDFVGNFPDSPFLSAGMSGDYMTALAHGATHIRVGSKILGERAHR